MIFKENTSDYWPKKACGALSGAAIPPLISNIKSFFVS